MQKLSAFVQNHVTAHQTAQLIGTTIVLWLLWEAFVIVFKIPHATISEVCWAYLNKYMWMALLLGIVLGHILWQYKSAWKRKQNPDGSFILAPIEPDDFDKKEPT